MNILCTTILLSTLTSKAFAQFGDDCTDLEASLDQGSFTSHANFSANYPRNTDQCWVISAPDGYVVKIWTEQFELEEGTNSHCNYDYLEFTCGDDGSDGYIGRYCGTSGIDVDFPVYSSYESIYVDFHTDATEQRAGFELFYIAVDPDVQWFGGNCSAEDSHERGYGSRYDDTGLDKVGPVVGTIVGIIIGGIVLVVLIIAVIACICCGVCAVTAAAAGSRRQQGYVQSYPLQTYPTTYPQTATHPTAAFTNNQPTQQYMSCQPANQPAQQYMPPPPANQPTQQYMPPPTANQHTQQYMPPPTASQPAQPTMPPPTASQPAQPTMPPPTASQLAQPNMPPPPNNHATQQYMAPQPATTQNFTTGPNGLQSQAVGGQFQGPPSYESVCTEIAN